MASGVSTNAPVSSKQKSKAYLSSVAIQSDAIKYRQKYKELKKRVAEIEQALTLRIKKNIQRLSILYERLEADMGASSPGQRPASGVGPSTQDKTVDSEAGKDATTLDDAPTLPKEEDDNLTLELEETL